MTPTTHQGRTFDWAARFDPRSLNYRAAPEATAMPRTGRIWHHGTVLDQGREGACVGMGCSGAVAAAPSARSGVNLQYALNWYHRAQRLDEWPGEAYEGTSVLAGCLVGRERKLWTGFRWAKSPTELAAGILKPELGPAILGVQWSEDLYDIPASGLMPADAKLDPNLGHCVLLFGYLPEPDLITDDLWADLEELGLHDAVESLDEPSFPLLNSWGPTWGAHGTAVAPLGLVQRWVRARGEFALPQDRTLRRARAGNEEEPVATTEEQPRQDETLHITAEEVADRDRILDPPDSLGPESCTVVGSPQHVSGWNGRQVRIRSTAGTFMLPATAPVTVRRPV
jgi:hypothetical protein